MLDHCRPLLSHHSIRSRLSVVATTTTRIAFVLLSLRQVTRSNDVSRAAIESRPSTKLSPVSRTRLRFSPKFDQCHPSSASVVRSGSPCSSSGHSSNGSNNIIDRHQQIADVPVSGAKTIERGSMEEANGPKAAHGETTIAPAERTCHTAAKSFDSLSTGFEKAPCHQKKFVFCIVSLASIDVSV